jgi:hypothetical protein
MHTRVKSLMSAVLLLASLGTVYTVYAAADSSELTGFPKIYQKWFEEAAAEFDVPVELLQSIAYTESRWRPIVPKGHAKKNGEDFQEADWHEGEMPPAYGIMGLRNDPHFGTSLNQAAALIHEMPVTLVTDTRSNIRGAAALLAQYGNRKNRNTPLEQWEEAVARLSGIPEREIAEMQTYEVFNAIKEGRGHDGHGKGHYKIKQRVVDLEKVYGHEKLRTLAASRVLIEYSQNNMKMSAPDANGAPAGR